MPDYNAFLRSFNSGKEEKLDTDNKLKERHTVNGAPDAILKVLDKGSQNASPYSREERAAIIGSTGGFNPNRQYDVSSEEYKQKEAAREQIRKAREQGTLEQTFNALERLVVSEGVLGILEGFGDIFDALIGRHFSDNPDDFSSSYTRFFEDLRERNDEYFKIYRENPYKSFDWSDFGWWADNFVSVGSTVSLMIPSKGIARGIGKLGKLAKADKWAGNAINWAKETKLGAKAANAENGIGKILNHSNYYGKKINEFADVAGTSVLSRIAENYQEARGVYKDGYNKILNNLNAMNTDEKSEFLERNPQFKKATSNEQIANQLASDAATDTFWEDMPLVLMDFFQYKGIESILKGNAKQITTAELERAQRKALARIAGNEALEKALDVETKGFFKKNAIKLGDKVKTAVKHPIRTVEGLELSEGFEEGWQGIVQAYNEDYIDSVLDARHNRRSLESYLSDGEVWEQAFWGVVGGIAFQKAAKGFNKLKQKHDIKKALKKGDITKEQYNEFIRANKNKRENEIFGRKERIDKLIDNLTLIEAGKDPTTKEGNGLRNIVDAADKAAVQNKIIDDWVTDFTLNAVDNGNMELLAEFIKSPEVNKYIQEKLKNNIGILNSKSLESRIDDVYELYLKNIDAVIENTSANDYDSVRKLSRYITRKELDVASQEDIIEQMRTSLSQLTDYTPGTDYEKFRKFDILYNQLDRFNKTLTELETSYKNHTISKSGYETEVERVNDIKKLIKEQLINLNLSSDLNEFIEKEDYTAIKSTVKNLRDSSNFAREVAETTNQIKLGIDDIIKAEIEQAIDIQDIPKTQADFENLYNSIDLDSVKYFNARVNKAITRIKEYLNEADDLDQAVANAMDQNFSDISDPIRRKQLEKAMDILKIGSHSYADITKMFNEEVAAIRAEREANKAKKDVAVENGKETKNPVDLSEKEVVEHKDNNDSSKGEEKQQKKTDTTDATKETANNSNPPVEKNDTSEEIETPQEVKDLAERDKADFEAEQKAQNTEDTTSAEAMAQGFISLYNAQDEEDIKKQLLSAYMNLGRVRPDLLQATIKDGVGSEAYNKFVQAAISFLTNTGVFTYNEVAKLADYQLKIYLHNLLSRDLASPDSKNGIFKLINDIDKLGSKEKLNEDFSAVETISDEQFNANMEKFLKDYFGLGDKVAFETRNGVKIINLDTLFADLVTLSQNGVYNFEELAEIVNNIFNYALNYKGKEFKFISNDIFDARGIEGDIIESGSFNKSGTVEAKLNNLTAFINKLYAQQMAPDNVIDDNMHFNISSTIRNRDLTYLKGKKLKIKYETQGGVKTISLYYTDRNGDHEVGYLGAVEADKENKTISLANKTGVITSVTKDNGEYHTTNEEVENILFKLADLINSVESEETEYKDFADALYAQFAYTKTGDSVFQLSEEDIKALINNKAFRHFLDVVDLKLPIGKEFTRKNGSKGNANVKIDSSNIDSLPDPVSNVSALLRQINNVLFYDYNLGTSIDTKSDVLRSGIRRYIEKLYRNYSQTLSYQKAIDDNKTDDIQLEFVAADNSYLNFDSSVNRDVANLGIRGSIRSHPFIYLTKDGVMQAEGIDKPFPNRAGFKAGTSGILLDVRAGNPMIAILRESKQITNNRQLVAAIKKEYDRLLKDYISSSGTNVLDKYNALLDFFNNLFGNSYSLFEGFRVSQTAGSFTIFTKDSDNQVIPLATFYKYAAIYDKSSDSWTVDGKKIPNEELVKHYRPTIDIHRTDGSDKSDRIKSINGKVNTKLVNDFIDKLLGRLTYSRNAITIDPKRRNKFIEKGDGTEFTLTIGDYVQHYTNYADYIVRNNAFGTTHVGDRKSNTMKANATSASSIFVKYTGAREYLSEEDKIAQQGFAANLQEASVKEGDTVSSEQVLTYAGYNQEELNQFNKLFDIIKIKPITISFEKRIVDGKEVYAGYKDGKIVFYSKAIAAISANKNHAPRLLIHESIHNIIDEKGFFTSHEYGQAKTKAIIDTWDQFVKASKEVPELQEFINNFIAQYGSLKTSDNFEDKAKFANEWIAEVLSNKGLMNYLNNIDYEGTLKIIQKTNRRSILQRIIDILKDLFTEFKQINANSLLEQFYNAVGNPIVVETTDSAIDSSASAVTETEEETIASEEIREINAEEELDDRLKALRAEAASWFDLTEDKSSNEDELFSDVDGVPEEVRMTDYLNDDKNNPYGLTLAPDMDSWLKSIPPHNRSAMASNLAAGALKYLCQ